MVVCDHQQRPNRIRKLLLLLLVGMFHRGNIQLSCKSSFACDICVNSPISLTFCSKYDGTISVLWTRSLLWGHSGRDGVSNHHRIYCLLNRLFRCRSKKTPKLRVTDFVRGIHRCPVNSPQKGPVTWKIFPFDDIIMESPRVKWATAESDVLLQTTVSPRHPQICVNIGSEPILPRYPPNWKS